MNEIIANRAAKYLFYINIIAAPIWLVWIGFDYLFAKNCFYAILPLRFAGSAVSLLLALSVKKKLMPIKLMHTLMFAYYNASICYMLSIIDLSSLEVYFNGYSMIAILMFFVLILTPIEILIFVLIALTTFALSVVLSAHSAVDFFKHGGFVFLTILAIMIVFGYLRYQGVLRDVSLAAEIENAKEIKELNSTLEQANKEKETLLKEIHHRVKNNLQLVSSILSLQNNHTSDKGTSRSLTESIQRIKSMSFIHETLYKSKNFASIDFSNYLSNLAGEIVALYEFQQRKSKVVIVKNLEPIRLDINQAVPCGLIANELITNSVKYAFSGREEGIIWLNISSHEQAVLLEIGDNGVGLPENFEIEKLNSLGMQLVHTLVEQLEGTIEMENKDGLIFKIRFNSNKDS